MSLVACICGETREPRVVGHGGAALLRSLECRRCGLRTPRSRIEHLDLAWATMQAEQRRKQQQEQQP